MEFFSFLYQNAVEHFDYRMIIMWIIGGVLIFLAIKREMEPTLLLPIGFGVILVNLPFSGAVTQTVGDQVHEGALNVLYDAGIANELFPLLLFVGIGAMIDFGPILSNPKLLIFGAAAQFGIFFTLCTASMFFDLKDAASISVIGAADGPTSIVVAQQLHSNYTGAIMVAAYSYMALVPIVQPPVIRLITTKHERGIKMAYVQKEVKKSVRILFPIAITIVTGIVSPRSVALIGFLMFGNLIRECGVLNSLSESAQNNLANLVTLLLGITVASKMRADAFLTGRHTVSRRLFLTGEELFQRGHSGIYEKQRFVVFGNERKAAQTQVSFGFEKREIHLPQVIQRSPLHLSKSP